MVTLEPLQAKHIPRIVEIEHQAFPTPWTVEAFHYELEKNSVASYLVAMKADKLCGYGGFWRILDEAHITNVAVDINCRRQGIAALLMRELANLAVSKGCKRMTLEVRDSNLAAQNLYLQMSFVSYGKRPGYYTDTKEDAIIMWKDL